MSVCHNHKHFSQLVPHHGGKTADVDNAWSNYVTVTLCVEFPLQRRLERILVPGLPAPRILPTTYRPLSPRLCIVPSTSSRMLPLSGSLHWKHNKGRPVKPHIFRDSLSSVGWDLQWSTYLTNLESLAAAITKIGKTMKNIENGVVLTHLTHQRTDSLSECVMF